MKHGVEMGRSLTVGVRFGSVRILYTFQTYQFWFLPLGIVKFELYEVYYHLKRLRTFHLMKIKFGKFKETN